MNALQEHWFRHRRIAAPAIAALLLLNGCDTRSMGDERSAAAAANGVPNMVAVGPQPGPRSAQQPLHNPYPDDAKAAEDGRRLFVAFNCAGCHGGHAGGGMGPSLRDQDWIYGKDDAQIYDSIAAGRAHGMPAWGTRLPQEQIWKLVTYIKTLGTDHEAQPPT